MIPWLLNVVFSSNPHSIVQCPISLTEPLNVGLIVDEAKNETDLS